MSQLDRRHFLTLSALAGAGVLTACTGAPSGAPTGGNGSASGGSLRFFTYEAVETIDLVQQVIDAFDAETGSTTTIDNLPGSGAAVYPDKLRTELLGGAGPDVWRIWGGQIGAPYAQAGQCLDLTPYYEQYDWHSRLNAQAVEGMYFHDMQAGVPYLMRGLGCWYNRGLLEAAGFTDDPTSYEELEALNEALVGNGVTPLGTGGKYGWHIMRLFEYLLETTAGPELHDKLLLGEESWDSPEVVEAFTRFKKWQDNGWIPEGALGLDPADIEPAYAQGTVAYTITGAWTEVNAIQTGGFDAADFGNFSLPTGHTPNRHSGFVEGLMINARSANPDLAAQLVDFIITPESQATMQVSSSAVIGAEPAGEEYPLSVDWLEKTAETPFYVIQDQAFPKAQADGYFAVQSDVLQGSIDPAEAATRMEEIISAWAAG